MGKMGKGVKTDGSTNVERNLWSLAQEPVDPMLYLNQVLNEIKKDRTADIETFTAFHISLFIFARNALILWYGTFGVLFDPFLCSFISFWAFQESNPPKALRAEHLFKLNEVCRENCEEISLKSDTREDKVTKRTRWQGDKVTSEGEKEEKNKRNKHLKIVYHPLRCCTML